jgi:hypothetical protein
LRAVVRFALLRNFAFLLFARDAGLRLDFAFATGVSFGCAATIAATTEAPHQLTSRRGGISKAHRAPRTGHSTALSEQKSQSYLDNLIAG